MITGIILTKNEEANIQKCLESISWCDEKLVIDDNSVDKTKMIAEKMGAVVYVHPVNNDFSQQRNYGLSLANGDWVLFLDADERVSPALWYEIMQYTSNPIASLEGLFFKRTDFLWGKELKFGETGNIQLIRLAKKHAGKWSGEVHEKWLIKGNTKTLQNALLHYPHPTVAEFLREINFYSGLRAAQLFNKKISSHWWDIFVYPKAKFFLNYIFKLGLLDGIPGLVVAVMMSFHSFLVRGKLWLLWQKNN